MSRNDGGHDFLRSMSDSPLQPINFVYNIYFFSFIEWTEASDRIDIGVADAPTNRYYVEGGMVATGQNLKRLIKHHLGLFFCFAQFLLFASTALYISDFFNRLIDFTNTNFLPQLGFTWVIVMQLHQLYWWPHPLSNYFKGNRGRAKGLYRCVGNSKHHLEAPGCRNITKVAQ